MQEIVEAPRISSQSAHEGGKVVTPTQCVYVPFLTYNVSSLPILLPSGD